MAKYLLTFPDKHHETLKALSSHEGEPIADYIRKGVEFVIRSHGVALSGAMLLGIQVQTTSGSFWIKGV